MALSKACMYEGVTLQAQNFRRSAPIAYRYVCQWRRQSAGGSWIGRDAAPRNGVLHVGLVSLAATFIGRPLGGLG